MADRIQEYLHSVPIVTRSLLVFNITIHILIFLFSYPLGPLAIRPNALIAHGEYYRLITSTYVHSGLLHILMNMSSLLPLGTILETKFGSWKFLVMTLWATLMCGSIYVLMAWICSFYDLEYLHNSAVGFSGVLFFYALIDSFHSNETSRSVFGFFSVPTKAYPVILLIVIQIIMPNISLFGHLAGIIFGLILISRVGYNLFMPSDGALMWLDELSVCRCLTRITAFVITKDRDLVHPMLEMNSANRVCTACTMLMDTLGMILSFMWNIISAGLHIIGFPVDRCTASVSKCCTAVKSAFWSVCGTINGLTGRSGGSDGGGQYELVSTVEPVNEAPVTAAVPASSNSSSSSSSGISGKGRVLGRGIPATSSILSGGGGSGKDTMQV